MTLPDLPAGWHWTTVEKAGRLQLGRQRAPKHHEGSNMRPYLRVANVFEDRIDTSDVMSMNFEPKEFERYKLHPGDVLLNEGQTPELLGRPAMYQGAPEDCAFTNSLIRFQVGEGVLPEWALLVFRAHMHSGRFKRESRITTNIAHLSAARLKGVEFPVPPEHVQAALVARTRLLEAQLDAWLADQGRVAGRIARVAGHLLDAELQRDEAVLRPLGELLAAPLINGRSVPTLTGGPAVLRLTALNASAKLDLTQVKGGDWTAEEASRFVVREGDFLVSRGNGSRHLVGRGGLVPAVDAPIAFPDTMIRIRPDSSVCHPEYLALAWSTREVRRQIEAGAKTTAGIYKINQQLLRNVRVPICAPQLQLGLVERVTRARQILADADTARRRAAVLAGALRRRLLLDAVVPTQDTRDLSS